MNTRLLAIVIVTGLSVSAIGLGAAAIVVPPVREQLVEGHTVFTVIERTAQQNQQEEEFAAAVAVLVREAQQTVDAQRFPGVLWFNDQYLVNPSDNISKDSVVRYPCTGAVMAVNAGATDPRTFGLAAFNAANYTESYYIIDPNNNEWVVDRWNVTGTLVWTAQVYGVTAGRNPEGSSASETADDGWCQGEARTDNPVSNQLCVPVSTDDDPMTCRGSVPAGAAMSPEFEEPGANGYWYPCGSTQTECPDNIMYNALLYFRLQDLTVAGANKNHTEDATATNDWDNDVAGCQRTYTAPDWPCPGDDDGREGNSHPYNPEVGWPWQTYAGRDNHGGSADCTGDGASDQGCHATRNIDLYFGVVTNPTWLRSYYIDERGQADGGAFAPFHCHDDQVACSQDEFVADASNP